MRRRKKPGPPRREHSAMPVPELRALVRRAGSIRRLGLAAGVSANTLHNHLYRRRAIPEGLSATLRALDPETLAAGRPTVQKRVAPVRALPDERSEGAPSLRELVRDYLEYLLVKKGRARSEHHRHAVERRVSTILDGARCLADVTPDFIEARMRQLLETPSSGGGRLRKRSTQTVDNYRRELGTFLRWVMRKRQLLAHNPVEAVDAYEAGDVGFASRPFSPAEATKFFSSVPEDRLVVYLFWATTGMRPAETTRLRWSQIVLTPGDGCEPYVQILRAGSKNRKAVRQPFHPDLAAMLAPLAARASSPDAPVFPTVPHARMFARDLERAGLGEAQVTPEGRLSRTSLRKLFATSLDRGGASDGLVQKLMRHSTPTLTRERYTHFDLGEKARAVAGLSFLPEGRRPGALDPPAIVDAAGRDVKPENADPRARRREALWAEVTRA